MVTTNDARGIATLARVKRRSPGADMNTVSRSGGIRPCSSRLAQGAGPPGELVRRDVRSPGERGFGYFEPTAPCVVAFPQRAVREEHEACSPVAPGQRSAPVRRSTWKEGQGTTSKVLKLQLRPDPLAR